MGERLAAGVVMHGPEMIRMGPYVTVEPGAELRLPWWVQGILFQCRHALKCT